jgi:hypothetical protein
VPPARQRLQQLRCERYTRLVHHDNGDHTVDDAIQRHYDDDLVDHHVDDEVARWIRVPTRVVPAANENGDRRKGGRRFFAGR